MKGIIVPQNASELVSLISFHLDFVFLQLGMWQSSITVVAFKSENNIRSDCIYGLINVPIVPPSLGYQHLLWVLLFLLFRKSNYHSTSPNFCLLIHCIGASFVLLTAKFYSLWGLWTYLSQKGVDSEHCWFLSQLLIDCAYLRRDCLLSTSGSTYSRSLKFSGKLLVKIGD